MTEKQLQLAKDIAAQVEAANQIKAPKEFTLPPAPTTTNTASAEMAPATIAVPPAPQTQETAEVPDAIKQAVHYNQVADDIDRKAMLDWQNMLTNARQSIERERTDNIKMAKFNALGNALRSIVQPLGWAVGGGNVTGGVQKYDDREYLAAFNRAIKAGEDLRNIDMRGADLQLRYAQQMAQNARNISNLYMRYGMNHGTSAGVDMDKVYQTRISDALKTYQSAKNNWHKGAKPITETFDEYLRSIGLSYFGLEDSPEALAALEKIGEEAEETEAEGTKSAVTPPAETVVVDERDTNGDGTVSLFEKGKAKVKGLLNKGNKEEIEEEAEIVEMPQPETPKTGKTSFKDKKQAGNKAYSNWKNKGVVSSQSSGTKSLSKGAGTLKGHKWD